MIAQTKLRREETAQILGARSDIENTLATFATKMVVMGLPGAFVAHGFSRNFYRFEPAFIHERGERTIDGGNAEPTQLAARVVVHFRDA